MQNKIKDVEANMAVLQNELSHIKKTVDEIKSNNTNYYQTTDKRLSDLLEAMGEVKGFTTLASQNSQIIHKHEERIDIVEAWIHKHGDNIIEASSHTTMLSEIKTERADRRKFILNNVYKIFTWVVLTLLGIAGLNGIK